MPKDYWKFWDYFTQPSDQLRFVFKYTNLRKR